MPWVRCCWKRSPATVHWAKRLKPHLNRALTRQCCRQTWSLDSWAILMASWSASSACWLWADRGRTISIPTVLKIQHPDPEEYWSELCIMHSDLWFNSLCFPPSTQQCILALRTITLTASANQNAAVTPTWAFKFCTCHGAKLLFEQGQHLESACVEIVALNFAAFFPSPVLSHDASRQQSINANQKWRWVGQLYQQNKSHPYGILNFKSSDGFFCLIILLPDHQFYMDLQKTNHTFLRMDENKHSCPLTLLRSWKCNWTLKIPRTQTNVNS